MGGGKEGEEKGKKNLKAEASQSELLILGGQVPGCGKALPGLREEERQPGSGGEAMPSQSGSRR